MLWLDRSSTWMDPIGAYLTYGALPANSKEADRVKKQPNWFIQYEEIMYKGSFAWPLLRCVTPNEGKKIREELHECIYSAHSRGRALAMTAIRTGYN